MKSISQRYEANWSTLTNKPIMHTITHELAHTLWAKHMSKKKHLAAGREIKKLHKAWENDASTQFSYGNYSRSDINEFWAEVITKALHGKADKYTRTAVEIAKKYKL